MGGVAGSKAKEQTLATNVKNLSFVVSSLLWSALCLARVDSCFCIVTSGFGG